MQKKSVKKNRRHANQTRRRKSIMRGGNKNVYIAILIALLAMKMLNNYYTEPPVYKETETAPSAAPSAAAAPFAALSAAPSAALSAAPSAALSARINRYTWNNTKLSNRPFGQDGPERNSKIHAMKFQDATHSIINNQAMSVKDKLLALNTFFKVITESNYPTQIARTSTIMNFCEDNEVLCEGLQQKYSWFGEYMTKYRNLGENHDVSPKTCDNNDINQILSRIINEDNTSTPGNLDVVAKEIAFATASNLVKKIKATTKTQIKNKEKTKQILTTNILEQMITCGYHADNNIFRLNPNCCFTEPEPLYKGGSEISIELDKTGKIVDTNNVNEEKLNAAIEFVEKTINLKSLTIEQLMKQINEIKTKNNIKILTKKNGDILIQNNATI